MWCEQFQNSGVDFLAETRLLIETKVSVLAGVLKRVPDAMNDVARKMQRMLRAMKAAQEKPLAGISEPGNCTGMAAGRDGGDGP